MLKFFDYIISDLISVYEHSVTSPILSEVTEVQAKNVFSGLEPSLPGLAKGGRGVGGQDKVFGTHGGKRNVCPRYEWFNKEWHQPT